MVIRDWNLVKGDKYMKIKIVNMHLKKVAEFIASLELSGKASRGKVKFGDVLGAKLQEFSKDFNEIQQSDKDESERNDEIIELVKEESVIVLDEYEHLVKAFTESLDEYDKTLKGDDAIAYDVLMTAFENTNKKVEVINHD